MSSFVPLSSEEQATLLQFARDTVHAYVLEQDLPILTGAAFTQNGAVFVTLHMRDGALRGCIGRFSWESPLWEAVRDMAIQAACHDPRFAPVRQDELDELVFEISVLTPPQTFDGSLVIGRDGLIVSARKRRGVLLPQVASERGWDLVTFLEQTCRKAGLPGDTWRDEKCDILVFQADVFEEHL